MSEFKMIYWDECASRTDYINKYLKKNSIFTMYSANLSKMKYPFLYQKYTDAKYFLVDYKNGVFMPANFKTILSQEEQAKHLMEVLANLESLKNTFKDNLVLYCWKINSSQLYDSVVYSFTTKYYKDSFFVRNGVQLGENSFYSVYAIDCDLDIVNFDSGSVFNKSYLIEQIKKMVSINENDTMDKIDSSNFAFKVLLGKFYGIDYYSLDFTATPFKDVKSTSDSLYISERQLMDNKKCDKFIDLFSKPISNT